MTISSSAASRKYFDRSSLTFARATSRSRRALPVEPGLGLLLFDDREDFDCGLGNVIEHPDLVDSKAILRLTQASKPLDATLARFRWFESEVASQSIPDLAPNSCRQSLKRLGSVWGQHDVEPHSG